MRGGNVVWGRVVVLLVVGGVARPIGAQNPVPVQLQVSPLDTYNYDPTPRLEFSGGHVLTFSVQNTGQIGGPDARVAFTCAPTGSVATVTTCPASLWLTPGSATVQVSLTVTLGAGGGSGYVRLTATAVAPGPTGSTTAGRRDLNVVAATATFTPPSVAVSKARGTTGTQSFTLTNTTALGVAFTFTDVAPACTTVLSPCSRTPAATGVLATGATQSVSVSYSAAVAGVQTLGVPAAVGSHTVVTAPLTVTVLDASLTPANASLTVAPGPGAQYAGFTVVNAPGGPYGTYDLDFATCSGVTNCRFTSGASTATITLSAGTPSQAVPVLFDAASGSGAVTLRVSFGGTPLATATLAVTVVSAVSATLAPATAASSATVGASTVPFGGFTLTNGAGSPASTFDLTFSACAIVTTCRFGNGQATQAVALGTNASQGIPLTFSAPAAGTGTVTVRAAYQGVQLATATLSVAVQGTAVGMTVVTQGLTTDSLLYRDHCVTLALAAEAASECGDLRVVHALPAVRTLNVTRAPVLTYSSARARPYPTVPANLTLPANAVVPTTVSASLKVNAVQVATASWPGAQWTPGATRRVVLGFDAAGAGLASGVYPYVLDVTTTTGGSSTATQATGQLVVASLAASPFGAGWSVAGIERLDLAVPARPIWYGGDGSVRVYQQRAGSAAPTRVWGAPNASYPDSIRESGSWFIRQLPDSVWVYFGQSGLHRRTRARLGDETVFHYDATNRLEDIQLPPGAFATALKYHVTYNANGKVSTITAPGQSATRTVVLTVDAPTGRLTSI